MYKNTDNWTSTISDTVKRTSESYYNFLMFVLHLCCENEEQANKYWLEDEKKYVEHAERKKKPQNIYETEKKLVPKKRKREELLNDEGNGQDCMMRVRRRKNKKQQISSNKFNFMYVHPQLYSIRGHKTIMKLLLVMKDNNN